MKTYITLLFFMVNLTAIASNEDSLCMQYHDYQNKANTILRNYPKSDMNGKVFADAWIKAYKKWGVDIPIELALAQAQIETGFNNGKFRNNPYNIRPGGSKYTSYNTLYDGVWAYYRLMAKDYLKCKTLTQLLKKGGFVNCNGHRYASYQYYEETLVRQMSYYQKLLGID